MLRHLARKILMFLPFSLVDDLLPPKPSEPIVLVKEKWDFDVYFEGYASFTVESVSTEKAKEQADRLGSEFLDSWAKEMMAQGKVIRIIRRKSAQAFTG